MTKVSLAIASSDYDHFRDFRFGLVEATGIDVIWLNLQFHELVSRFVAKREWHVSEMSFAKFSAMVTAEDSDIIGLPVFPNRVFRLSAFYVNTSKGIRTPADLRGKRVGLPEWAQSAVLYARGWLQHDAGVPLTDIDWVQAGTEVAGRIEKVDLNLPKGLRLTRVMDKTLSEMLVTGELDAVISATAPIPFQQGNPAIKRLFDDPYRAEVEYYRRSGIYPIMHVLAVRKDILEEHPWIARNLFLAFEQSKRNATARIFESGASRYPIPWLLDTAMELRELLGDDIFPYGIQANYKTLEAALRYSFEQGIASKLVKPEAIFPEGLEPSVKL